MHVDASAKKNANGNLTFQLGFLFITDGKPSSLKEKSALEVGESKDWEFNG